MTASQIVGGSWDGMTSYNSSNMGAILVRYTLFNQTVYMLKKYSLPALLLLMIGYFTYNIFCNKYRSLKLWYQRKWFTPKTFYSYDRQIQEIRQSRSEKALGVAGSQNKNYRPAIMYYMRGK